MATADVAGLLPSICQSPDTGDSLTMKLMGFNYSHAHPTHIGPYKGPEISYS